MYLCNGLYAVKLHFLHCFAEDIGKGKSLEMLKSFLVEGFKP